MVCTASYQSVLLDKFALFILSIALYYKRHSEWNIPNALFSRVEQCIILVFILFYSMI